MVATTTKIVVGEEVPFLLSAMGVEEIRRRKQQKGLAFPTQDGTKLPDYLAKISYDIPRDDPDLVEVLEKVGQKGAQPGCSFRICELDAQAHWRLCHVSNFEVLLVG